MTAPQDAARAGRPHEGWGGREVLLAALSVLYPFHFGGGTGGVLNVSLGDSIVALVMLGLGATAVAGRIHLPRYTPFVLMLALVALASLVIPLLRPDGGPPYFDALAGAGEIGKLAGSASWMVAFYVLLRRDPVRGLGVFALGSVLMASVFAATTVRDSLLNPQTRPTGPFENGNLYANYLVFNVLLAIMLARAERRVPVPRRLPLSPLLFVPLLSVGVLATGSRGGLIAGAVACLWVMRRQVRRWSARGMVPVLLTAVLAGAGIVAFWQTNAFIADRLSSIVTGEGPNVASREDLWGAALEAFLSSPLTGIGSHQFPAYAEAEHGLRFLVAHNTYLQTAAELGSLGLAAFLALVLTAIRDGVRMSGADGVAVAPFLVAVVLAAITQGAFTDVEHYRSLWMAFGALAAVREWARAGWPAGFAAPQALPA